MKAQVDQNILDAKHSIVDIRPHKENDDCTKLNINMLLE